MRCHRPAPLRRSLLLPALAGLVVLSGCGSSSKPTTSAASSSSSSQAAAQVSAALSTPTASTPAASTPSTAAASTPAQSTPAPAAGTSTTPAASGTDPRLARKPVVQIPSGPPPTHLLSRDLIVGHGAVARTGHPVLVQYVGVLYPSGKQFDASWDRGQPFSFQIGAGQVIQGWDLGVAGMRVGGRRELIIPPALAYGPAGRPPIGPNQTLVFVIDLLATR